MTHLSGRDLLLLLSIAMLSNTNLSKEAATLTKWLVSIPSVAHAKGPALICQAIHDGLAEFPYFKKHNDKLHLIEHKDSTKSSVVALVKALEEVEETIVLLCDTDTTSPYHYGMLKGFSTNCDELRNRLLENEDLSDSPLKDGLNNDQLLFGLGVLQSKCATGSMLVALKELSDNHVRLNVNILFICTSESAIQHRGIKKCIPFIQDLIDQEHLKLRLAINAKPNFPLHRKDQDLHIFTGNYGKVEPSFYIIGNSTASFKPYSGFSASIIASELIRELELNAKLTQRINHAPLVPTFDSLRVKEFGKEYSPDGMQISFSLPIVNLDLADLLEVLKDAAAKAIEHAADLVDQREALYAHINQEDFHPQIQDAEVVSFSDLLERASHNFTGNLQKALAGMVQKCRSEGLSLHQASITIIERLNELAKLPRPSVVVYFTDNFLPPQGLSASLSQDREIFMILDDLLNRFAQHNAHSPSMATYYAPSDACLMRPINMKSSLKTLRQECPVGVEELESLNVPTITLGVKGDNLTLLTEYVDKSMFEYLPAMVVSIVDALGENPVGSYHRAQQDLELNLENLAQKAENIASAAITEARSVTKEQQEGDSFYTQLSQGTLEPQNLDTFLKQQQDFNKNAANSKMAQKLKEQIPAGALESPDKFSLQLEPTNTPEQSLETAASSLPEQDTQSAPEITNTAPSSENIADINSPSSQEITASTNTSQAQSDPQENHQNSLTMESHIDLVIDAAHLEEDEAERTALAEKEQEQSNDIQQAIAQSINNDAHLNQELNKADDSTLLEPTKVEVAVVPEEDDEEPEQSSSKFDKFKKLFKLDNNDAQLSSEQDNNIDEASQSINNEDTALNQKPIESQSTKIAQEIATPEQNKSTTELNTPKLAQESSNDEAHTLSDQETISDVDQDSKSEVSEHENQIHDSSSSKLKSYAIEQEPKDTAETQEEALSANTQDNSSAPSTSDKDDTVDANKADTKDSPDSKQESLADNSAPDLSTDATLDSETAQKEAPIELTTSSTPLASISDKEQDLAASSEQSSANASLNSHTDISSCALSASNDLSAQTLEQDSTIDDAQNEIIQNNSSTLDESVLLKEEPSVEDSHLEQEQAKQQLDNHDNDLAQESKSRPFAMVSSFFKHFKFGKHHDKSAHKQDALTTTLGVEDDVDWINTPELAHKQAPELSATDKNDTAPVKDLAVENFKPFIPVMPQTFKDLSTKAEALANLEEIERVSSAPQVEPLNTELTTQDDANESNIADTTAKTAENAHKQDTKSTETTDSSSTLDVDDAADADSEQDIVLAPQNSEVSSEQVADLLLNSIKDKFKSNSLASIDNPSDYQHHDLPLNNNVYANDINLDEVPVKIISGTEDGFNSAAQAACHKGNNEAIEAEIVEDDLEKAQSTPVKGKLDAQDGHIQSHKDEEPTLEKDTSFTKSSLASQSLVQDNAQSVTADQAPQNIEQELDSTSSTLQASSAKDSIAQDKLVSDEIQSQEQVATTTTENHDVAANGNADLKLEDDQHNSPRCEEHLDHEATSNTQEVQTMESESSNDNSFTDTELEIKDTEELADHIANLDSATNNDVSLANTEQDVDSSDFSELPETTIEDNNADKTNKEQDLLATSLTTKSSIDSNKSSAQDDLTTNVESTSTLDSTEAVKNNTAAEPIENLKVDTAGETIENLKVDTTTNSNDDANLDNLVPETTSISIKEDEDTVEVECPQNLSDTLEPVTCAIDSETKSLELESGNNSNNDASASSDKDNAHNEDQQLPKVTSKDQVSDHTLVAPELLDASAQLTKQEEQSFDDKSTIEESIADSSLDNAAKKAKAQANAQRLLAIQKRIAKTNNNLSSQAQREEKKRSAMEELSLRLAAMHSKESTDSLKGKIAAQQQQVQEDKSKSIKVTLPSDIDLTKAIDSNVTMLSKKSLFISEDPHNTRDIEEVFAEAEAQAAAKRAEVQKRLESLTKAMAEERASLSDDSTLATDNKETLHDGLSPSSAQESPNVSDVSADDLKQDSSLPAQEIKNDKQQVANLEHLEEILDSEDQEQSSPDSSAHLTSTNEDSTNANADNLQADLTDIATTANEDKSNNSTVHEDDLANGLKQESQEQAALASKRDAKDTTSAVESKSPKENSLEQTTATKNNTDQDATLEEVQDKLETIHENTINSQHGHKPHEQELAVDNKIVENTNNSLEVPTSNTEQNTSQKEATTQTPDTKSSVAEPDLDSLNQLIEQAKAQAALAKQKDHSAVIRDSQDEFYPNVGVSSELNEQRKRSNKNKAHDTPLKAPAHTSDDNDPTVAPLDDATRREMSSLRKINPEEAIAELLYADEDFSDDNDEQQDNLAARRAALRRAMYGDSKDDHSLHTNSRQIQDRAPSTMEAVSTSNPGVRILRTPNANLRKAQREQKKDPISPTAIIGQKDRVVPEKKADPAYSTAIIGQKERVVPEKGADPEYSTAIIGQKERVVHEKKAGPEYSTAIIGQKDRVVPKKGHDPKYSTAIIGQKERVVHEKNAGPEYSTAIIGQKERVVPEKGHDPEYSIAIIGQKDRVVPEKKADPEYSTAIIGQKERVVPEKGHDPEYSTAIIGQKDRVVPEKKADPAYSTAIIGQKERVIPEKSADPAYATAIIGKNNHMVAEHKEAPAYATAIIAKNKSSDNQ